MLYYLAHLGHAAGQHEREGRWWWEEATKRECGLHESIDDGPIAGGMTQMTSAHLSNMLDDRYFELEKMHGREAARLVGERLRQAGEGAVVEWEGEQLRFTVSIGLAALLEGDDPAALLARADKALYRAKRDGRNRVVAMEAGAAPPSAWSGLTD